LKFFNYDFEKYFHPVWWTNYKFRGRWIGDRFFPLIGICGYTRRAFTVGDFWSFFFIRDLIVMEDKNRCEEEKRCLNKDCPLNKTSISSFLKSKRIPYSKEDAEKVKRLIIFLKKYPVNEAFLKRDETHQH